MNNDNGTNKVLDYNQKVQKHLWEIFEKELITINDKKKNKIWRKTQSSKIYIDKYDINNHINKLKNRLKIEKKSSEDKILSKLNNFFNLKTFLNFGNIFKQMNLMDFEPKAEILNENKLPVDKNLFNNLGKNNIKFSQEILQKIKKQFYLNYKDKLNKKSEIKNKKLKKQIKNIYDVVVKFEENFGITIDEIYSYKNINNIISKKNKMVKIKNKYNNFINVNNNFNIKNKNLPDIFYKNWTINKKQEFFKEFKKITNFIIKGIDKSSNQIYSNRINDSMNRIFNVGKKIKNKTNFNNIKNQDENKNSKVKFQIDPKDDEKKNTENLFVIKNVKNFVKKELKQSNNISTFNSHRRTISHFNKNSNKFLSTKYDSKQFQRSKFNSNKLNNDFDAQIKQDFKIFNKTLTNYNISNIGFNRKIINKAKLQNKFKYEEEMDIFKENWKTSINDINNVNFFSENKLDWENQLRIYRKQNNIKEINKIWDILKEQQNVIPPLSKLSIKKKNKIIWTTCNYFKHNKSGIKFIKNKLYYY